MLHQLINISANANTLIAFSGGVDSVAITDFYYRGGKKFKLAYFNHGTPQANQMQAFAEEFADKHQVKLFIGKLEKDKDTKLSTEEFFRIERYRWLCSLNYDLITCHHLNDAVEGYLFSCLHGNPSVISPEVVINYGTGAAIVRRPFLTTPKSELLCWARRHDLTWFEDASNAELKYMRNRIRHNILPEALKINPGLMKVLKKKIVKNLSHF